MPLILCYLSFGVASGCLLLLLVNDALLRSQLDSKSAQHKRRTNKIKISKFVSVTPVRNKVALFGIYVCNVMVKYASVKFGNNSTKKTQVPPANRSFLYKGPQIKTKPILFTLLCTRYSAALLFRLKAALRLPTLCCNYSCCGRYNLKMPLSPICSFLLFNLTVSSTRSVG